MTNHEIEIEEKFANLHLTTNRQRDKTPHVFIPMQNVASNEAKKFIIATYEKDAELIARQTAKALSVLEFTNPSDFSFDSDAIKLLLLIIQEF